MFGFTIVRKDRLKHLEECEKLWFSMTHYAYWFSGFQPTFWLLKKFIKGEVANVTVSDVRSEFAKMMGTDAYGEKLEAPNEQD